MAQPHPILDNFTAYLDNDKIILKWTIISGSTCNGIRIYRSGDTTSFSEIGSIAGICGSSSTSTPYEFSDEAPIPNQINYYRLELGTQGYSTFISIEFIKLASGNYLIRPNPVVDVATIYFQNDSHLPMKFTLTNASGNILQTKENITEDYIIFRREDLISGLYIFTIEYNGDVKIKGKIIL
ncbi:MAG TPA: T9SS type A sorting domain-containing protein [Chitinophagaceae bacterium]|nr:T9SS type A sorting domain-containing protein [Chitinophagaceae bacterium]